MGATNIYVEVTDIPGIMDYIGWSKGSKLMRTWLSRPATIVPNYSPSDTSTISMDWVLSFGRAKSVYDKLIQDKIWCSQMAQKEIKKNLQEMGLLSNTEKEFPLYGSTGLDVNKYYINYRPVDYPPNTMDDMLAALGSFVFRTAVGGIVTPVQNHYRVTIKSVGIYVRDSYDFEKEQFLGIWNKERKTIRLDTSDPTGLTVTGDTPISNRDFREWRNTTGRGGDFEIFSNLVLLSLNIPDVFEI